MECNTHDNNPISLLCVSCEHRPVCNDCIVTDHNGHRFLKAHIFAERNKDMLSSILSENKQLISDLQSDILQIESAETLQKETCVGVNKQIDKRKAELHKIVDDIADTLKRICLNEKKGNIDILQEQKDKVNFLLVLAKKMDSSIRNALRSDDLTAIISASRELKPLHDQRIPLVFPNEIQFQGGVAHVHSLKAMCGVVINKPIDCDVCSDFLGSLVIQHSAQGATCSDYGTVPCPDTQETQALTVLNSFLYKASYINTIKPSISDSCWVTGSSENKLNLVDRSGTIKNVVNIDGRICGIDINPKQNKMFLCGLTSQYIQKVYLSEGKLKNLFSTAPLFPCGIAYFSTGELLVIVSSICTMTIKNNKSTLVKYSTKGRVIARSENEAFAAVARIRINHSEDTLVITNSVSNHLCCLMLLNRDLTVKMSYLGKGNVLEGNPTLDALRNSKSNFRVSDICTDRQDNILLSETYSRSVQMLSPTCQYLRTLIVENTIPVSLAVNGLDEIWISFKNGEVKICKII